MMTFGSLFAGIGGFDLGLERTGMKCLWQVEIDPFCRKVLQKHWPEVPKYEDVRKVGKHNLEPVDLICGGFPCQDISFAGKGGGLQGKRSGLWYEMFRIFCELRPRYLLIENVTAILVRGGAEVLSSIASVGYDAEWEMLSAAAIGAPHIRNRVFFVAYPSGYPKSFRVFNRNGKKNTGWDLDPKKWCQDRNFLEMGTEINRRVSQYKEGISKPSIPMLVDGIPETLDQIRSYGNAVVPQVIEYIGLKIINANQTLELTSQLI